MDTIQHQHTQQDRLDALKERESLEHGWSLPRCPYPNLARVLQEAFGFRLKLEMYYTDDGRDDVIHLLMDYADVVMAQREAVELLDKEVSTEGKAA